MSSDWKESAIKRRDFRHSKSDPEVAKGRKKKSRGKKPWKIVCDWKFLGRDEKGYVLGRYKTEDAAKNALQSYKNNWWGEGDRGKTMRIEKDD
jgi:hypothetical protein